MGCEDYEQDNLAILRQKNKELMGVNTSVGRLLEVIQKNHDAVKQLLEKNKKLERKLKAINDYCIKRKEFMWAAEIYGFINECDFRDISKECDNVPDIPNSDKINDSASDHSCNSSSLHGRNENHNL